MGLWDIVTYLKQITQDAWKNIVNPDNTEEDDEYITEYVTQIRFREPLRPHKMFFVNEMPDFFTDEELNEGYHTKQEYVEANSKYGYIYKYQKFENADTVEKLQEYATDWIRNNYHGGLTSFDITALDMHLSGDYPELDPYIVGDKIDVYYFDSDTRQEEMKMLSCISAEYDLYNPEKTKYKIGIPDTTLNKVYGETVKSGGGGGGGNNTEEENDEEDDNEVKTIADFVQEIGGWMDESIYGFMSKWLPGGDDGTETTDPNLEVPKTKDPTNPFTMNLTADNLRAGLGKMTEGVINSLQSAYIKNSGKITTNDISAANNADIKEKTTTKDFEATNNAEVKEKTTTKDLETTGRADIKELYVDGNQMTTIRIAIDGVNYTLYGKADDGGGE